MIPLRIRGLIVKWLGVVPVGVRWKDCRRPIERGDIYVVRIRKSELVLPSTPALDL